MKILIYLLLVNRDNYFEKNGKIFVFFIDPDQIIIKHTRIQDSGGRWRVEFEPIKVGIYQIQTNDNGNDESPIILASMDILPSDYQRTIEGERIIHPNVLNFILINSNNENLKIRLRRKLDLISTFRLNLTGFL